PTIRKEEAKPSVTVTLLTTVAAFTLPLTGSVAVSTAARFVAAVPPKTAAVVATVVGVPFNVAVPHCAIPGTGVLTVTLKPFCGMATFRKLFVTARTPAGEEVSRSAICDGKVMPEANTFTRIPTVAAAQGAHAGLTPITSWIVSPAAHPPHAGRVKLT